MRLFSEFRERLRAILSRTREEQELDEELRFHVEMETEANIRRGLDPEEARRQALLAFGGVERFKEEVREARGLGVLEHLVRDVRFALRRLVREPGFTVPVVATLALGIGVTAAVFALVDGMLLKPLPYPESDRLVTLRHVAPGLGITDGGQSEGTYLHYSKHNRVFEEMGLYFDRELSITEGDTPERIVTALVTPGVLSTLKVAPLLGRLFTAADGDVGAPRTVMISHELWVRRYGADPQVIGRTIELNRGPREIVGVMPRGFAFPRPETQLWFAMPVEATTARIGVEDMFRTAIARLKPGLSPADAGRDLERMVASLPDVYPDVTREDLRRSELRGVVVPLKEAIVRDVHGALTLLAGAAVFLFLIASANVVNLFLVRAERQRKEVAVARSLGAADADVARRFLSESMLIALAGGTLALALAEVAVKSRFGFEPGQLPRLHEVGVGGAVVRFVLGLSLLCGILLGVLAFLSAGRPNLAGALKGVFGRVTAGRKSQRVQRFLVATQVALAVALLIASAVLSQSFWRLRRAELGFDPRGLLMIEVPLPARPYLKYHSSAHFFYQLLAGIRALPGITAAEGLAGDLPLRSDPLELIDLLVPADPPAAGRPEGEVAAIALATPGYFQAMRIPLRQGRSFETGDLLREAPGVIVSAALAQKLFPGEDPIGKRVRFAKRTGYASHAIVGTVGDVPGERIADGPSSTLYLPVLEDFAADPEADAPIPYYPSEMSILVRTSLPPTSLVPAVRQLLRELDPKVPIARVGTMEEAVARSMARTRLMTLLLLLAAGTSLFLGVIGIYGVVAYAVSQRVPEFGVRLALGATPAEVSRLVLRQGVLVTIGGLGAGLFAAFALTRLLRGLLYQVSPGDPVAFLAMPVFLLVIATAASYLPARRAGRIDPARALRAE